MPIYEYKCLDCGSHIERMQKVSEESLKFCEKCGGKLEKQWSLSGFQFKGAGWYVTDYAKKISGDSAEKSQKSEKSEKNEKSEKAEKSSATESTAKAETASNKPNDDTSGSKKEVKKD
jgi:putative FmdB family regulatory protein